MLYNHRGVHGLAVVGIFPIIFILFFPDLPLESIYHKEHKPPKTISLTAKRYSNLRNPLITKNLKTPKTVSLKAKRYSNHTQYSNITSYYIFHI